MRLLAQNVSSTMLYWPGKSLSAAHFQERGLDMRIRWRQSGIDHFLDLPCGRWTVGMSVIPGLFYIAVGHNENGEDTLQNIFHVHMIC